MWDLRPVDLEAIESHSHRLLEIAKREIKTVTECGADPLIVVHAIQYLEHCQAIPPMSNDTAWFEEALAVLIGLCCPNSGPLPKVELFLQDLEAGIAHLRGQE